METEAEEEEESELEEEETRRRRGEEAEEETRRGGGGGDGERRRLVRGQRRGLVRGQRRRLVIEVELYFVAARAAPLAAAFAVGEQLPVVIGAGEGHLAAVQGGFLCCRSRTGRASA